MIRPGWLVLAILGLAACGQGEPGTPDVGTTGTSPYVATCLEMVTAENWSEAERLCSMALAAEPNNDEVKAALQTAAANVASEPEASSAVAAPSGEAAGEAADDAADAAQQGPPD